MLPDSVRDTSPRVSKAAFCAKYRPFLTRPRFDATYMCERKLGTRNRVNFSGQGLLRALRVRTGQRPLIRPGHRQFVVTAHPAGRDGRAQQ